MSLRAPVVVLDEWMRPPGRPDHDPVRQYGDYVEVSEYAAERMSLNEVRAALGLLPVLEGDIRFSDYQRCRRPWMI